MWGGGCERTDLRKGKLLKLAGGELPKGGGGPNVAKFGAFLMQMMQGF